MNGESVQDTGRSWPLESGIWAAGGLGEGFSLVRTGYDRPVSSLLTPADLSALLPGSHVADRPQTVFPPEFKYCPATGQPLQRPASAAAASSRWVPPFGAATIAQRTSRSARGLRQTAAALKLARLEQRRVDGDPDATLGLPPPGDYEFLSTPAATPGSVLMALDPSKGLMYLLLPASRRWELLEQQGGGMLGESHGERAEWRCEIAVAGSRSRIFLATESGLACVSPDAASLSYAVNYIGSASAVGAPLQLGEQVWAPLRVSEGAIRFVSANLQGEAGMQIDLPPPASGVAIPERLHAPLTDGRTALWPCDTGQLLLRLQANGSLGASFQPWPTGLQPAFEFGSPYLSRDGSLWQLCFDAATDQYVYLQLGVDKPERASALAPRLCSGSVNFRFATKFKSEPWLEPEHGDDGASDEVIVPILESTRGAEVLGLKLETTAGLADVLRSAERIRVALVLDDAASQTAFHMMAVAEPWRLRVFLHGGLLWAYHPLLNRLDGWTLQS